MRDTFSLYEAKAKLSAIVRQVREGRSFTITLHGEPVAELRPLAKSAPDVAARADALAERGILVRPAQKRAQPGLVVRRPGALKRFLDERE